MNFLIVLLLSGCAFSLQAAQPHQKTQQKEAHEASEKLMKLASGAKPVISIEKDIEELVRQGADVNYCSPRLKIAQTPLLRALFSGNNACAQHLISMGADVHNPSTDGHFPLHYAHGSCVHGGPKLVQLLLDYGAGINAQDAQGKTPLMRAVHSASIPLNSSGAFEIMNVLLNHKGKDNSVDLSIKDAKGNTAFESVWRCISNSSEVEKVLKMLHDAQAQLKAQGAVVKK